MDKNKQIRKERYVPEFDPSTTAKRDCLRCKYLHLTASQCFSVCRRAYEELQAENELLKKKMKELQELGCFISDETGHKCLLATENEKLSKALKEILKEVGTSTLANKIAQQALKEGE